MDWVKIREQVLSWIRKYRYPILVVLLGIALMCLPGRKTTEVQDPVPDPPGVEEAPDLQQSLEEILTQIQGAGKVKVLLSIAKGEETVFQTNEDQSTGSESGSIRVDTVIVSDESRKEHGLVRQTVGAVYKGAVIVCQGGDRADIRLAIVEAVSSVTGLGADHISVLKMK